MAGVRARECAWLVTATAAMLLVVAAPLPVHAQTAAESLDQARHAYTRGEFGEVVRLLEPVVGGATPSIADRILVRESRKYLGAAYVLTDQRARAEEQFLELLRAEGEDYATFRLDRTTFPGPVTRVFAAVQDRFIASRRERREATERESAERERLRRAALDTLRSLAEVDEVVIPHEPALAWIPFGVGQFQNGDESLGAFFLTTEAVTLAGAVVLAAWSVAYEDTRMPSTLDTGVLRGLQIANWVSAGAFAALAVAGIFEAHISFVPSHTVRREREIPADVLERLDLTLGPSTVGLRLRF